ncbi:MAG: DegT/DnrJ/EryC1/StrS family aminotransferase [Desulfuromonadales bacterium]
MAFKVPFGTITITDTAKKLINESLDTKRISSGKFVRQFEDTFAEIVGVREAVALSSGTDADILALAVLHDFGAHRGDEVIVPALSFVSTGGAIIHAGFTPVFVDVERSTLNIDPSKIEAAITPKTCAIMPVHLMGKPAEMNTINAIAKKYKLAVVEDAAEAHGALYHGNPAGSLGDMGAFSTYIAHIITTGEGGVVTTNNEEYAEVIRSLRSHGRACACKQCSLNTTSGYCAKRFRGEQGEDIRFTFERIGYSCKMNEMEAAIGIGAMEIYHEILTKRHDNLMHVLTRFEQFSPFLTTIKEETWEQIGPHAIPIIIQKGAPFTRVEFSQHLEQNGIETRTLFNSMPTQCQGFGYLGYKLGDFPNAEYIGNNAIHLGCHQDVGIDEMDFILEVITGFIRFKVMS